MTRKLISLLVIVVLIATLLTVCSCATYKNEPQYVSAIVGRYLTLEDGLTVISFDPSVKGGKFAYQMFRIPELPPKSNGYVQIKIISEEEYKTKK